MPLRRGQDCQCLGTRSASHQIPEPHFLMRQHTRAHMSFRIGDLGVWSHSEYACIPGRTLSAGTTTVARRCELTCLGFGRGTGVPEATRRMLASSELLRTTGICTPALATRESVRPAANWSLPCVYVRCSFTSRMPFTRMPMRRSNPSTDQPHWSSLLPYSQVNVICVSGFKNLASIGRHRADGWDRRRGRSVRPSYCGGDTAAAFGRVHRECHFVYRRLRIRF